MSTTLRLALQKSGRLSEDSRDLIRECGIKVNRYDNKLKAAAVNFPVEFLYLRDDDIPEYVADGVADAGIVGRNLLIEKEKQVDTLAELGFSKCRLSIAVPRDFEYQSLESLQGKSIATSYPNTLKNHLKCNSVQAAVREINGSTEIAPGIGLADAICDLVSSGSTLLSNGLKEVECILESEAVLVRSTKLAPEKEFLLNNLLFRIQAVLKSRNVKYILMNAPNDRLKEVCAILPGLRSPTVVPLAESGWSSVHTVIQEDQFWEMIEKLRKAGAEGIVVTPIEKMIT